jgi:hypothetical protein
MAKWSHEYCTLQHMQFLAKPYWTMPFDDRTPAELLTSIEQNNARMLQQIKEMPELHSTVQLILLCDFLQDILITEAAVAADEALDCSMIDGVAQREIGEDEFVQQCGLSGNLPKLHRKLANLSLAAIYIRELPDEASLTVELVLTVHTMVMQELVADGGELGLFRANNAMPSRTTTTSYADYTQILRKLERLLDFVRTVLDTCDGLEQCIRIGAYFLSEFLLIHGVSL